MKYTYLLMAASIGLLAGCSQIEQDFADVNSLTDGDNLVEKVVFDVLPIKEGDDPETKASAVPTGSGVSFAWEESDMIGIYPNKGSQIYFTIEDGAGSSSATFDGGGWALKQNASYVSYYPFVADFFLSRDEIPVSFAGQKQVGTESPFNGARYFLASETTSSENGVLRFSYNTLNTIINVNATLPAGTYTKASLTIEEPLFVEEGTYSLDERTIVGTKFTNKLEIELEDVVLTEDGTIPIYIMSAPVDLKGKEVIVRIISSDGQHYECIKTPSKAYEAGTRYGLTCDKMDSVSQPNNVIYYTSSDGQIVTPNKSNAFGANIVSNEYINGQGIITFDGDITIIGDRAFENCTSLYSISLPEGLVTIGDYSFMGCYGLAGRLIIPDGVTSIGDRAFQGCSGLSGNLVFPNGLVSIGNRAFQNCSGLSGNLAFPNGLVDIGDGAFQSCSGFTGNLVFPDGLVSIGDDAFQGCSGLSGSLVFPDGLVSIGDNAFQSCTRLTGSLVFPDGLVSIGNYAFQRCSSLTGSLVFPSGLVSIGDGAFQNCTRLTGSLSIPDTVTSIGMDTFFGCSGFTGSLSIPDTVTSIGMEAFYHCSGFTGKLTLPNELTSIDWGAFEGCSGFTGELTLPDGLMSIGFLAFRGCSGFTCITSLNVTPPSANGSMFDNTGNCPIYVPFGSVEAYKSAWNWSEYADRIQAIPEPNNVIYYTSYDGKTVIPFYGDAFGANMVSNNYVNGRGIITFDGDVTGILADAFKNCSGLTSITIPESVTRIGTNAFYYCQRLTSISIPESVTSISSEAFYYCNSLISLVIPKNVTSIGNYAFSYCNSLSSITINALSPPTLEYGTAFEFTSFPIYVPEESVEAYKAADGWSGYSNRIYPIVS